jgi:serine/threonine protein kinase
VTAVKNLVLVLKLPKIYGCTVTVAETSKGFFLLQVLKSLAYMHSLDLIHCDLKPENILIKSFSR